MSVYNSYLGHCYIHIWWGRQEFFVFILGSDPFRLVISACTQYKIHTSIVLILEEYSKKKTRNKVNDR